MRQVRRLLTAVLILLGAITVVPAFSGLASAHHSEITASVACSGTVSWTANSWSTGAEGTNTDIRVFLTYGSPAATSQVGQGAFNNANNYKFSGTFAWPTGATSITVSSKPYAKWGNGNTSTDGRSVTITTPANCPGQPGVSKAVSCTATSAGHGDGTIVLTLSNAAGGFASSVSFDVYNPDQTVIKSTYSVAPGQTKQVTFGGLADGSHSVKIMSGSTNLSQTFSVDCDSPIPAVTNSITCANGDGQIVVTLSNTGGKAVVFDVTNPQTNIIEHVTVNADTSTTRTFSGFADGDYKVVIKVGAADYSQSFTIDCDHPLPKVTSSVACDTAHDGAVTITLANEGTEAVVFHVTNPNTNVVENVTVAAGASTTRTFSGFNDGLHTVTVTADGQDYSQSFTAQCDLAPSFSHAEKCVDGDGSVDVTMTNDGDDVNAVFLLDGTSYTLAPGATKVVTLAGLADGSHLVPMIVNGLDKGFTVVVDCDRPGEPAVETAQSCADEDGLVVVTLKNIGGQLPLTFTVQGIAYQVAANSSLDVPVAGLLDGTQIIAVTQGNSDFSQQVSVHCDQAPTVDFTKSCIEGANGHSDGSLLVTLHNNGDDVDVTFVVNGQQYNVAPKASQNVTIDGLADGNHHIAVLAGALDLSFDVTVACDHPGAGSISTVSTCADNDGKVTVTLIATGGELPVVFTVNGTPYTVQPDTTQDVVITGLNDGTNHITVLAGQKDLSFDVNTTCDLTPLVSYTQACSNFDDTVTVLIENRGDDVSVTFTINGTDYTLLPGQSQPVLVDHLADGDNTITVAINGVAQNPIEVKSHCDPVFIVTPICNSVDIEGAVAQYWFTINNTASTDVSVTWTGGSATVPAGQSIVVGSSSATLVLSHDDVVIARTAASEAICERTVEFTKDLKGQPETSETYSIRISRLVGDTYVEETTFSINAGETKTVNLPSTLDPAGFDYKFEEINAGTASTSTVSPDQMKLSGHLGETIAVVVTNGYAAVRIDKSTSTSAVLPGGQITYTLQAVNTGGLTLDPVVVSDRLPSTMEMVSATVAGGAGQCTLAQATRPQLVSCTMNGSLAPGASASLITIVVTVDSTIPAGTTIVNQAMVHGAFTALDGSLAQKVNTAGSAGGDLSCVPAIAGTVCDLSAKVGVPVTQIQVSPPTPATATEVVAQLPRTGATNLRAMLALGFAAVLLGGALLLSKRRLGAR